MGLATIAPAQLTEQHRMSRCDYQSTCFPWLRPSSCASAPQRLSADQTPAPKVPTRTPADDGFTDTPMLPGLPWRVHDPARPHPPVVHPAAALAARPLTRGLVDGRLSHWAHRDHQAARRLRRPGRSAMDTSRRGKGSLVHARSAFRDCNSTSSGRRPPISGDSQGRGNSGVFLMGLYECRCSTATRTRPTPTVRRRAIYGQWPPLVNAARKPGEWQTYDIVFEAPRFENG